MANPKVEVEIAARLNNIDQQFSKVASMASDTAAKINSAFSSINLGSLTTAFSLAGIAHSIKSTADAADAMSKMSQRTGETVENLSKLQYAASLADLSDEDLAKGLTKLNKVMGDAANGSKEATDALARFGILPNNGKSLSENFRQIADRVKNTGDETRIASALNEVFEKSYADMIPLLKQGGDAIQRSGDELERLGGVMTGELAKSAEEFNDNLTRISKSMEAIRIQSLGGLISGLEELTGRLVEATKASGGFWKGLLTWSTTDQSEESDPGAGIARLVEKLKSLEEMKAAFTKDTWINRLGLNKEDLAIVNTQIAAMTARLEYLKALQAKNGGDYRDSWLPATKPGESITNTPAKPPEVKPQISEGERLIDQLRQRLMTVEQLTEAEKIEANILDGKYPTMTRGEADVARALAGQIDARTAMNRELDAELASVRELNKEFEAQDARLKSLIASTPAGQATQKMMDEALAESALRSGKITESVYDQIIAKLHEVKDEGKNSFDELQRAIEGWGKDAASAIVDFTSGSKTSFSDMVTSWLQDLARMLVYQNLTKPLADTISKYFSSTSSSSPASRPVADALSDALAYNAQGGVYSSPSLSAYSGGVFSSPRLFKFASGAGVFGEAGPEAIMPLKRGRDGKLGVSGASGNVTVNVINNASGAQATQSMRSDGNGGSIIDVVVEQVKNAIGNDIGRGAGPVPAAMERTYGLNRAVGAY